MSHTTTINAVKVTDIKALKSAVKELQKAGVNCELVENQKPRMYYKDQHGNCDYVLKLPDSKYDVGFQKQEDGSFGTVFDEWNGDISRQIGADMGGQPLDTKTKRAQQHIGKLMQGYSKHAAMNAARSQGHIVQSAKVDKNNNIQLEIVGY